MKSLQRFAGILTAFCLMIILFFHLSGSCRLLDSRIL